MSMDRKVEVDGCLEGMAADFKRWKRKVASDMVKLKRKVARDYKGVVKFWLWEE